MQNKKFQKLIRRINIYPPYLGMAIRVRSFSEDFTRFEVELRSRWYNRNLFGTHFGGCLYSMCDPRKNTYHFEADLLDERDVTVARVSKEVYIRAKSGPN